MCGFSVPPPPLRVHLNHRPTQASGSGKLGIGHGHGDSLSASNWKTVTEEAAETSCPQRFSPETCVFPKCVFSRFSCHCHVLSLWDRHSAADPADQKARALFILILPLNHLLKNLAWDPGRAQLVVHTTRAKCQDYEFKPYTGHGVYLKNLKIRSLDQCILVTLGKSKCSGFLFFFFSLR